jgi:aminopeptidase N
MRRYLLLGFALVITLSVQSQFNLKPKDESWKQVYRATETKINDLVHTKLNVKFDFIKSQLKGKAWLTLKPHFYATDSLNLDAKGMDINTVALASGSKIKRLTYTYDSLNLRIKLDRSYKANEPYTIYIDYVAKPDEYETKGSEAITDAKGLYFINPRGEEPNKPTQVWTQGETEASSVWFPTIDRPNQKTTQELSMTVPAKYVTLSNGKLISQTKNLDGTRTDTWKMDLPHSPYLFFMGVGDYAVVKDSYKGKEVSYYVEKDYEKVARKIFGNTPEMMKYYSNILGVEYPWIKYSQIVGRDFVSGAMENTTATLHQQSAQQNARQLVDGNKWEYVIAHELFHQWFGDLVTAESWSNLTVNESFANYGEILWNEYKYGQDVADDHGYKELQDYINSSGQGKDLVRYYYSDKEDMFDEISYNKGGRILHMLRNYVGDSAFFKSLNLYLTTYKFKNAEAAQLRLAFEEVTGKDLTWFWNQWYYGSGHPTLNIKYEYDESTKTSTVFVRQVQAGDKVFRLPFAIDIYNGANKVRHNVWMNNKTDTFRFKVTGKPDLINVDADKMLLAEKRDNKTLDELVHQYKYAKRYLDRREALDYAVKHLDEAPAKTLVTLALNDSFFKIRERALSNIDIKTLDDNTVNRIIAIAKNDAYPTTRAAAIDALAPLNRTDLKDLYVAASNDSSYSVAGAGIEALLTVDSKAALAALPKLKKDAKGRLEASLKLVEVLQKGDSDFDEMSLQFDKMSLFDKYEGYRNYLTYLGNVNSVENFKKGVDKIVEFRNVVAGYSLEMKKTMNNQLASLKAKKLALKTSANAKDVDEQLAYIDKVTKD